MKVKVESEKVGLKLNIQKTRIMASGPITSWQIDGETVETVSDFNFLGSKITADVDCSLLSPFTVHLKLLQYYLLISYTPIQNTKFNIKEIHKLGGSKKERNLFSHILQPGIPSSRCNRVGLSEISFFGLLMTFSLFSSSPRIISVCLNLFL